jgi:hypothetical protein
MARGFESHPGLHKKKETSMNRDIWLGLGLVLAIIVGSVSLGYEIPNIILWFMGLAG